MGFVQSLWQNRWLVLIAGLFLQSCGGIGYVFSLYSQIFKTELGYNQKLLDTLATFKDIGGSVGIISGFIFNWGPPWVCILIGAIQTCFGYGMLWLAASERIPKPPFWQMALFICVGTNGQPYNNTAILVTCLRSFPNSRGIVVGLIKGYIGLSGAIFTQIYLALYAPDQGSFLLLVAWLPASVALALLFVIRPLDPEPDADLNLERRNFKVVYGTGVGLAVYLMIVIIVEDLFTVSRSVSVAVTIIMLVLIGTHMLVPVRTTVQTLRAKKRVSVDEEAPTKAIMGEQESLYLLGSSPLSDKAWPPNNGEGRQGSITRRGGELVRSPEPQFVKLPPIMSPEHDYERKSLDELEMVAIAGPPDLKLGDDYTAWQAVCTIDFWLLFVAMVCGTGAGLTAINNMAQMGNALGYSTRSISTYVSLLSIWNFLGRLAGGLLSEQLVHFAIPRPVAMVVTQALMVCANLLFASAIPGSLYVGSIVIGMCYGAQWAVMPSTASEIFGLRHFGIIYNLFACATPIGSYILGPCIAGFLYDREVERASAMMPAVKNPVPSSDPPSSSFSFSSSPPPPDSDATLCSGPHCFRLTFIIIAAFCALGSALSAVLSLRTRRYYSLNTARYRSASRADRQEHGEDMGGGPGVGNASDSSKTHVVQ